MIHASLEQFDQKRLSILESAGFDTRDSLLLEWELSQFPLLDQPAPGRGPNIISLEKWFYERQREAAAQNGSDFISFGIELSSHSKRNNEQTLGGHDPRKRKLRILGACFKSV